MTERGKLFFDLVVAISTWNANAPAPVIVERALKITGAAWDEAVKQGFVHVPSPPPPRPDPMPLPRKKYG